jgi:ABC-type multidrug transport system fused ATPase/permease subunit
MRQNTSLFQLTLCMLRENRELIPKLWWVVPATMAVVCAKLAEPYMYKLIIDSLPSMVPGSSFEGVYPMLGVWLGIMLFGILVAYVRNNRFHHAMQLQWGRVIGRGMESLLKKDQHYHLAVNNGEKIKLFNRGVDAIYDATWRVVLDVSQSAFLLVGYVAVALYVSPMFTLTLLGILPILVLPAIALGNAAHRLQKIATKSWDLVYSVIGDSITNQAVVRLFARIQAVVKRNSRAVIAATEAQSQVRYLWSALEALQSSIEMLIGIMVIGLSLFFYARGEITVGEIVLFLTIASKISAPFLELERSYRNLVSYAADYSKYREMLDLPPEQNQGVAAFPQFYSALRIENVSFSYSESKRLILTDITLHIGRGEKIALVGHTGSGKSTITNLITRFYHPTQGGIFLDTTPIESIELNAYRSKIAAVFQDTTLFNESIRHNLEFVREGITQDAIRAACRDANILEFIESLPDGFDTIVGER